ncbi:DNA-binding transcriptional MerR regulator [Paenibacillus castaneae]|uniref:MerR family transcriptional regulator n=1 Tax=Paenibacillus castaneae TaxID=474957 RepID=UPI000C9B000B|nr:MerR family transcriptional regulator [Paenibacillus castaneae]NIK80461.1 DNA-binding transcriptional MerR regulator [Paenibacillus castaneae]
MVNDQSYTIGHVSRICGISIQTLRYYDNVGLLCPSRTDPFTHYRYYSNMDILLVKIVQDLKSLRFSLEEIGSILKQSGLDGLTAALKGKKQETLEEIERLQIAHASIENRIRQLESLRSLNEKLDSEGEVVLIELKQLADRIIAFERKRAVCGMEASVVRFTQLFDTLEMHGLTAQGQLMSIYHENLLAFDRTDSDIEVSIPLSSDALKHPFVRTLPGGEYITATYSGPPNEESCKNVYRYLLDWMGRNGYAECGPAVEQYVVDLSQMRDPGEFIVELQIPVEKVLTL